MTLSTHLTDRLSLRVEPRVRALLARIRPFPDRWSRLTGHVVLLSGAIVLLSGAALLPFFTPSTETVTWHGAYPPLDGTEVSRAFASTVDLSLAVPGGLLLRQLHAWSSSVMIAAIMVHLLRVFFTGAFRGRRLAWALIFAGLFVAMGAGLTGVVLPDDLVSGSSLAVLDGLVKSVPLVGSWISALVFQGEFPSGAVRTFYPLHIAVLPALLVGIGLLIRRQGVDDAPARALTPRDLRKHLALAGGVLAVLLVISATVTINPVWLYGPADPGAAAAGTGAVWYLAFLDGAQRLVPPGLEFTLGGTVTVALLVPVIAVGVYFAAAVLYPWLEDWITGDRDRVPQRPRSTPTRTAIGVAAMVWFGVLWAAGGADSIAYQFRLGLETVIASLQLALLGGPLLAYVLTRRICLGLQRRDREQLEHGYETGRIVRLPGGEYHEVHAPIPAVARPRILAALPAAEPHRLRPRTDGRILVRDRVRAQLSRWWQEAA